MRNLGVGILRVAAVAGAGYEADGQTIAGEPAPDKRAYHLFRPTPTGFLREMSTDRPDQTESPYTVDAGHFQFEVDFVNATWARERSGDADVRTEAFAFAPFNLKVGLLNHVDVQFIVNTYEQVRVEDRTAGTATDSAGLGDVLTRLKINLWGNDEGKTALGLMPFVKWPLPESSLRNGRTEGGLIVPFALDLGRGWGLGAQTAVEFVADEDGGYDTQFINSVTVGHNLTETLGMYVEFFTVTSSAPGFAWQGQIGTGWTYALGQNVQLDWGCNFGVTRSAPDFNPFAGLSVRF